MRCEIFTLGQLAMLRYGKSSKKIQTDNGNVPIYGTGGLMGYSKEALYDKPSVLIGRKGSISKVRYVSCPFWVVDTMFYTEVNNDIVMTKYLYYLMLTLDLRKYDEGTTIPSLRAEALNGLEFRIPPLEVQEKITAILSPLDDKIELNRRINANLEQQAQAVFKYCFIDSMSADCVNTTLGNICSCVLGGTPSRSKPEYWNGNIPWINSGEVNNFRIIKPTEMITELGLSKSATKLLPAKTTVIAITGATLGNV